MGYNFCQALLPSVFDPLGGLFFKKMALLFVMLLHTFFPSGGISLLPV
jgi:hypothetical protein